VKEKSRLFAIIILAIPLVICNVWVAIFRWVFPVIVLGAVVAMMIWGMTALVATALPIACGVWADWWIEDDDDWDTIYAIAAVETYVVCAVGMTITFFC
jgi:hypothetical protein